ncbi:type IV pilin [Haloprofundus salinisoli]|uniref:type IV pilin n=1 Tax=Haloprofundus salinisoli TaxID=2876193 RepID=UPI001CCAD476|nr:type IV pilin N-terminal domain-containing protein [Haloprofundus salinisoli]
MNIKKLFNDERAVSPVIGVILMVAITVILAAVIGTFVLGLGDQVGNSAPQASFDFSYSENGEGETVVTIVHAGGADISGEEISVQGAPEAYNSDSTLTSGSVISDGVVDGDTDTIRVVWENPAGGSSTIIAESQVP